MQKNAPPSEAEQFGGEDGGRWKISLALGIPLGLFLWSRWGRQEEAQSEEKAATSRLPPEIEDLHRRACDKGEQFYTDPSSGLVVFTSLAHKERGYCCGGGCRHCPYEHTNVPTRRAKGPSSAFKPKIYTRMGDKGTSSLFNGERRPKSDPAFEVLGSLDELVAAISLALEYIQIDSNLVQRPPEQVEAGRAMEQLQERLAHVQSKLFDALSVFANPSGITQKSIHPRDVSDLEAWLDDLTRALPAVPGFILPSGGMAASHLHLARTICRRTERAIAHLREGEAQAALGEAAIGGREVAARYVNRLSDLLYQSARCAAFREGRGDALPRRGAVWSEGGVVVPAE